MHFAHQEWKPASTFDNFFINEEGKRGKNDLELILSAKPKKMDLRIFWRRENVSVSYDNILEL